MLDRQKVEAILSCRFPGAGCDQIAAAANAIMGLAGDWDEIGFDDVRVVLVPQAADDTPALAAPEEPPDRAVEIRLFTRHRR